MHDDPILADEWEPAYEVLRDLRAGYEGKIPNRRKLIELGADGVLPLEKQGREWGGRRSKVPVIARGLGLRPKAPPPQRRRKAAADEASIAA